MKAIRRRARKFIDFLPSFPHPYLAFRQSELETSFFLLGSSQHQTHKPYTSCPGQNRRILSSLCARTSAAASADAFGIDYFLLLGSHSDWETKAKGKLEHWKALFPPHFHMRHHVVSLERHDYVHLMWSESAHEKENFNSTSTKTCPTYIRIPRRLHNALSLLLHSTEKVAARQSEETNGGRKIDEV